MFPQHARSKTQEIESSTVSEAISSLSYSKSFNAADSDSNSRGKPSPMLRPKVVNSDHYFCILGVRRRISNILVALYIETLLLKF